MTIKSKIILIFFIFSITHMSLVHAHPGHGNAETTYFYYLFHHVGNPYVLILLVAFILLLLRVGIKR